MWHMFKFSVQDLLANFWSKRCLRAHGLFGDGLRRWVLKFFQHFLSFCWCLVALNVRHLQLTVDRPWNVNDIKKTLSGLENVLQKPHEAFQGLKWIYRASRKTWCRHTAWFWQPLKTKWNIKSKKHSCKNNARSQRGVKWQTDATGLQYCDLSLPLSSFTKAVQQ
jgi:hypothetical protein